MWLAAGTDNPSRQPGQRYCSSAVHSVYGRVAAEGSEGERSTGTPCHLIITAAATGL